MRRFVAQYLISAFLGSIGGEAAMERPGDGGDVKLGVVAGNCVDDAEEVARGEVAEEPDRHPNRGRSDQNLFQRICVVLYPVVNLVQLLLDGIERVLVKDWI